MKKIFLSLLFFAIIFSFSDLVYSQSDYEMVQSFKERLQKISGQIKAAASLDDLNAASAEIENLKRDFSAKKEILDQSLYPDNFTSAIDKLSASIETRSGDFTEIVVLQTEVKTLKSEIDLLNQRNTELINQISLLESQRKKDASTIAELQKLVSNLRSTILKRDELIYGIVDSLAPKLAGDVSTMTSEEKQRVYSQVEKNNVLAIVKKSLRDNSRFLEVTSLKAKDLEEVKKQQNNFADMWRKIGPKLVDVYANKKDKSAELKDIDNLFDAWRNNIQLEVWESIREDFSLNNISLPGFTNGNEFTSVVNQFISDEIKNYGIKSKPESERVFTVFVDSLWFKSISSDWMPYLIDNNLLTIDQKNMIDKKISEWKSVVKPTDITWLYAIVALVVILLVVLFFIRRKKSANTSPPIQNTNN